jgi:hypothetical protein
MRNIPEPYCASLEMCWLAKTKEMALERKDGLANEIELAIEFPINTKHETLRGIFLPPTSTSYSSRQATTVLGESVFCGSA